MTCFYEKFYFTPGDLVRRSTPRSGRSTLVCWDQWYPEAARLHVPAGANVPFYLIAPAGTRRRSGVR
jgi:N-carbamoylputrescine amidase